MECRSIRLLAVFQKLRQPRFPLQFYRHARRPLEKITIFSVPTPQTFFLQSSPSAKPMTGFNNQQIFGRSFFCQPPLRRLLTRGVLAPLRSLPSARLHGGVGVSYCERLSASAIIEGDEAELSIGTRRHPRPHCTGSNGGSSFSKAFAASPCMLCAVFVLRHRISRILFRHFDLLLQSEYPSSKRRRASLTRTLNFLASISAGARIPRSAHTCGLRRGRIRKGCPRSRKSPACFRSRTRRAVQTML